MFDRIRIVDGPNGKAWWRIITGMAMQGTSFDTVFTVTGLTLRFSCISCLRLKQNCYFKALQVCHQETLSILSNFINVSPSSWRRSFDCVSYQLYTWRLSDKTQACLGQRHDSWTPLERYAGRVERPKQNRWSVFFKVFNLRTKNTPRNFAASRRFSQKH